MPLDLPPSPATPPPGSPTQAPPGGHYTHAVAASGLVFVSGQLPIAPDGRKLTGAPFEEQVAQVLRNMDAALHSAGSPRQQLVQVPELHFGLLVEVEGVARA